MKLIKLGYIQPDDNFCTFLRALQVDESCHGISQLHTAQYG